MHKQLQRYINQQIDLIYIDRLGKTSKRTVLLKEIKGDRIKVYCLSKRAPRVFLNENILAVYPSTNKFAM